MPRGRRTWAGASVLAVLLLVQAAIASADQAVVSTDGGCLRLREAPSLEGHVLTCLPHGATVETLDGWEQVDGYAWREVRAEGYTGWVAAVYLQRTALPDEGPAALPVPPPGGLTIGVTGTASADAFVAAQPFEVASLLVFEVETQRFRTHIPGSPLDHLRIPDGNLAPTDVVLVRRAAAVAGGDAASAAIDGLPGRGSAVAFRTPPRGGLTAGLAGTPHLDELIEAQPFAVDLVAAWNVTDQTWLLHRTDAPTFSNTLRSGLLFADTPVFLRRSATAPDPEPPPAATLPEPREERITYYYCEPGALPASWGDGGGWCGTMRNGEVVHPGAAACSPDRLGERFRIEGDPTERIYICTDTGGFVGSAHRDIWFHNSDDGYRWRLEVGPRALVVPVE